jgi:predicted nucleotide-binding protein with TIR-like domain
MKPRIFIGSSVEGKPIAEAIAGNFTHDAYPTVWDQMVFLPSTYPLESLLKAVADHDFGILVLSPDDVLKIKGATAVVPRGNVLFEAALFIGKHGRDRCFLIQPRSHPAFTLPTDLEGIVPATYDENHYRINPSAAVGPACTSIRSAIKSSASFNRAVMVAPKLELADPATSSFTYPKKLALTVTNPSMSAVLVTSRHFEVGGRVNGHADRFSGSKNVFRVEFFAYKDHSGTDIYQIECLLKTGTSARAWLALDSSTMMRPARDALAKNELGIWRFTCHWLTEPLELREYELAV